VLDMNDRALRSVEIGFATKKGPQRKDRFDITAASEIMAVLCLSKDFDDLRARLDRIVVGTTASGGAVTAGDLKAGGALAALLLEAAWPNLVRTLEGNPVFIHGGPFANVAQGTSTLMQTKLARKLADVVVTEAGFAFDLGGFKFLDIKCRAGGFRPAAIVLVATVRALRFHGASLDYNKPDANAVVRGLENIAAHVESMQRLGLPSPIISLNRFPDDTPEEVALVRSRAEQLGVTVAEGTYFADGASGALELADAVRARLDASSADSPDYRAPYADDAPLDRKVDLVARVVLGADASLLTDHAKSNLATIEGMGLGHLPLCLAKTHLSISDDQNLHGRPPPFTLKVTSLRAAAGAGFIVALCGPILTMPGLPEIPAAQYIDVERGPDGRHRIRGLK
jgi:formate--tetrahydrofolate ligase